MLVFRVHLAQYITVVLTVELDIGSTSSHLASQNRASLSLAYDHSLFDFVGRMRSLVVVLESHVHSTV